MTGALAGEHAYTVRPYRPKDEAAVVDLLQAAMGGGPVGRRTAEFFRWKHGDNPFGASFMLVAEAEDRIIGLRAFLRWRFRGPGGEVRAVRAVDTATHPDHRGRGVFSSLTRAALEALRGEVDLVFNTPNENSLPGYLKMGWTIVGKIPVAIRVRRPLRFVMHARAWKRLPGDLAPPPVSAPAAAEVLARDRDVADLLARAPDPPGVLRTPRSPAYLRWRYADSPGLDYRAVWEEREGRLHGLALFRVRPRGRLWESTVAEVIAAPRDRGTVRRLLRRVARAAPVDHLTCSFPGRGAGGARGLGFLPSPVGVLLVANPLTAGLRPDPLDLRSWGLSLGDVEVF